MFISVWVFFVLGDSLVAGEAPAYEQREVSRIAHDYAPEAIERDILKDFHKLYPHHVVCDSGWCRQQIEVNKP